MKRKKILIQLLLILFSATLFAQIPEKFQGTWDWKIQDALVQGYDTGWIVMTKDSFFIKFESEPKVIPAASVVLKSDTLQLGYIIDNLGVNVVDWIVLTSDSTANLTDNWEQEASLIKRIE